MYGQDIMSAISKFTCTMPFDLVVVVSDNGLRVNQSLPKLMVIIAISIIVKKPSIGQYKFISNKYHSWWSLEICFVLLLMVNSNTLHLQI